MNPPLLLLHHVKNSRSLRFRGRGEGLLLGTRQHLVGSGFLPPDAHQVEVMLIVRNDGVHLINITLPTDTIPIEDVHRCSESGHALGQSVVLCGLPRSHECFVSGRESFFRRCHPAPHRCLEGQSSVLFNVFWMVEQVLLQGFACFAIVVVPRINNTMQESRNLYNRIKLISSRERC